LQEPPDAKTNEEEQDSKGKESFWRHGCLDNSAENGDQQSYPNGQRSRILQKRCHISTFVHKGFSGINYLDAETP
jgi:hypothetical protein